MEDNNNIITDDNDDVEAGHDQSVGRTMSFTKIYQSPQNNEKEYTTMQTLVLAYQSLGVVYGDLATSPVNVFSSTSNSKDLTEEDLMGTLSLIIWTLTLLVLIKYIFVVLHANDHGEGGTFALYSYICRHIKFRSQFTIQNTMRSGSDLDTVNDNGSGSSCRLSIRTKKFIESHISAQNFLTFIVLLGTCMVVGDGALTPATCVLSALQGIQSLSPKITQEHVVWMSVVLLVALFAFQHRGTGKVGSSFSPIMLLWFGTNVVIGVYNVMKYKPSILKAVSPHYIVNFCLKNGKTAWSLLGAVFLSITGAEAMFADLGHFNKRAIQWGFSTVVYPSLVLSYAGETAYLVKNPKDISNAYYSSIPKPVYWPMFVISTLAAVVASQSMISACFSIVRQSLALGCFPRVNIVHTSSNHEGQIYSPEVNYILMILTLGLVVGFKGGVALTNAYGVVVIWVMIITTFLTTLVLLVVWETHIVLVLAFFLPYILIESIFMTSLMKKIPQGGWVPFAISALFLTVMFSWSYGRCKKTAYEEEHKTSVSELDQALSSSSNIHRTPGVCFFFTDLAYGIPPIIRHYIENTSSIQQVMVVVTVRTLQIKSVLPEERFIVGELGGGGNGLYRCLVQFGYKDDHDMKADMYIASILDKIVEISNDHNERRKIQTAQEKGVVFIMGRTILKANRDNGSLAWFATDYLYRFLQKNSVGTVSMLEIPFQRTMQIGMVYEL